MIANKLPVRPEVKDQPGWYLVRQGVPRLEEPSNTLCPYCKGPMAWIRNQVAITRTSRVGGVMYGDILPRRIIVLRCRPCKQHFCIDPQQD